MIYLDKNQVAERLGIKPRTAAVLMMEMNPIAISGKTRMRYRVTEESLDRWMAKKTIGKPVSIGKGTTKRLERR